MLQYIGKLPLSQDNFSLIFMSKHNYSSAASGGAVYGLGLIGALVFYLSTAANFGAGLIGILKAIVWPAFLVYELFSFLLG